MPVIVKFALMLAGFVALAATMGRRARRRFRRFAALERPPFAAPASTDLRAALAELLGVPDNEQGRWTITSSEVSPGGPEVAQAVWTRVPKLPAAAWAAAQLDRPVALPITFGSWKPHALASLERGYRTRYGVEEGVLVEDERLGRQWLAWVADDLDHRRSLDADPTVWPVMQALTPASVTAGATTPPSGFKLDPRARIHFRGRFVLIGPGSEPTIGAPGLEDLRRAAEFVATTFHHLDTP
ncbi:MAG: hypothetical protein ACR2O6_12685 [Ilumatobacteraceae bacterium]